MTMTQKVFEPFSADIAARAKANPHFREVVSTGPHAQVVVMSIPAGQGVAILDGERSPVEAGRLVHVPAGTRHNVVNEGTVDLKLYTVYAPPQHAPGTIHRTRAEADADEEHT